MEIDAEITLRTLVEQRDRLLKEIEALRNQIAGIEIAIELISGSSGRRARVSHTLLDLLRESGDAGLTPTAMVEAASRRGINLNRGSVYTLLTRMERTGTVVRKNSRYRLTELSSHSEGS